MSFLLFFLSLLRELIVWVCVDVFAGKSAEQACARQGEENFTEDEEEPERSNCVT